MNIKSILNTVLDDRTKGIPGGVKPFRLADVRKQRWNVLREDMPLPLLVLKKPIMENNARVFKRFLQQNGLSFAPHGKTTMAPQLIQKQLEDGAWAITAATVNQMQVYRAHGVQRILLANQLIGRQNVKYVVEEHNRDPQFDFYCLMDSVELVHHVAFAARAFGLKRPIKVLIEGGIQGGRTGCRTVEQARAVLDELRRGRDVLAFTGIEGYEGIISGKPDEAVSRVDQYLEFVKNLLNICKPDDFGDAKEVILSAGGTAYFDRVAAVFKDARFDLPVRVVLRSGCYLTHDSGGYEDFQKQAVKRGWCGELRASLEIWSYVQSIPEPGLAILTMGKRDCPYDVSMPYPEKLYRPRKGWRSLPACEVTAFNDQHGYMRFERSGDLRVGDMIASGISHPCTAFDKWRFIPVVDDAYDVVDGILTFF